MTRARTIAACTNDAEARYADPFAAALANLRRIDREMAADVAEFIAASEAHRAALQEMLK